MERMRIGFVGDPSRRIVNALMNLKLEDIDVAHKMMPVSMHKSNWKGKGDQLKEVDKRATGKRKQQQQMRNFVRRSSRGR